MTKTTNKLRFGAIVLAGAMLAACGGGDKEDAAETITEEITEVIEVETPAASTSTQALIDKCTAEGESEAVCACQIVAVEGALGEDNFSKLIVFAENDDDEGAEALITEVMTDNPEVAMKMATSMMACSES